MHTTDTTYGLWRFVYTAYPDKEGGVMYLGKEVLPISMKNPQRLKELYHALYHAPTDETGYGGRVIGLDMVDGTKRDIRGPWATNILSVEMVTGIKFKDAVVITSNRTYQGYMVTL
jgi:hypothetical protein